MPDLFGQGVIPFEALGIEKVVGEPLYDNGTFYVVDTVKDLQFAVLGHHAGVSTLYRTIPLDKYEAIRVADELLEAERRNGAVL